MEMISVKPAMMTETIPAPIAPPVEPARTKPLAHKKSAPGISDRR